MKLKMLSQGQNRAFQRLQSDQIRQIADDIDTLVLALIEADAKIEELEAKLAKTNELYVGDSYS